MDSIHIQGGMPLQGQVRIQGSKNAVLPILAATLLIPGESMLYNCPRIADVFHMITLLESLGCKAVWEGNGLRVDARGAQKSRMPREEVTGMRSSIVLLGPMLGRLGEAEMEYPGGCVIGRRPIDMHINALEKMGVQFTDREEGFFATVTRLRGTEYTLTFPSVGATENIILAAVLAEGNTVIRGAAREPEITALIEFLEAAGARISGKGTDRLRIVGVERLRDTEYQIPADRIVAGTYLLGCLSAGGCVFLERAPVEQLGALLEIADRMGALWQAAGDGIYMQALKPMKAVPYTETKVYPGFPTDLQSPLLAALATADGESIVKESIFENRFRIVRELQKMGADMEVKDSMVKIKGVECLSGAMVEAEELRGGAALVLAGLNAQGTTVVNQCGYINRGYENICKDLRELGVRIYSV